MAWVRACQGWGRGFESPRPFHVSTASVEPFAAAAVCGNRKGAESAAACPSGIGHPARAGLRHRPPPGICRTAPVPQEIAKAVFLQPRTPDGFRFHRIRGTRSTNGRWAVQRFCNSMPGVPAPITQSPNLPDLPGFLGPKTFLVPVQVAACCRVRQQFR